MWVGFGASTIVPGLDRTSPAAQIERRLAEQVFDEADGMLAYNRRVHMEVRDGLSNIKPVAKLLSDKAADATSGD